MKKAFLCFIVFAIGYSFAQAQVAKIDSALLPVSGPHYQAEYNFDVPVNSRAWENQKPGLQVAFGSEDQLYFRAEVPSISNEAREWQATGWKGERLNAQIVVWSSDTVEQVRFQITDLKNERGKLIPRSNIQLNRVSYVLSNYPYGAKNAVCGTTPYTDGYLMPDRLIPLGGEDRFDLPGRSVRPVWVSCDIPSNIEPGIYTGHIDVNSQKGNAKLKVSIKVQNQILPKPADWKFRLDLWQNPWAIAEYYHVKPWGADHKTLLKKHLQLYANAGGTFITTYAVHSPWGDNEYAIEGGMIEWIKTKTGSWRFDYSIFDQYIELAMSVGINEAITIYTPLPWGERFRYLDEATGNYVYEQWLPTAANFKNNWNAFLTDLMAHLKRKGWFNKTYLGVNENAMEQTLAAIKVIKEHSKEWRITYAGDWHRELDSLLDDYSSVFGKEPSPDEVRSRSTHQRTSTFYICCTPPMPNTFVFSPPIEGRWLGWYTMAHHYDGFLRWAYDAWPADPLRDARFGSWAAGDCYLVYPGGNSSIRFEKLREGIVDYEKIRMIKQLAAKSSDKAVKKLLAELDAHLQTFNAERDFNEEKLKQDIQAGKKLIEQITDLIARQNKMSNSLQKPKPSTR